MLPSTLPVVPPLPSCSVPARSSAARIGVVACQDQRAAAGLHDQPPPTIWPLVVDWLLPPITSALV
jgi:hypothetical protein